MINPNPTNTCDSCVLDTLVCIQHVPSESKHDICTSSPWICYFYVPVAQNTNIIIMCQILCPTPLASVVSASSLIASLPCLPSSISPDARMHTFIPTPPDQTEAGGWKAKDVMIKSLKTICNHHLPWKLILMLQKSNCVEDLPYRKTSKYRKQPTAREDTLCRWPFYRKL